MTVHAYPERGHATRAMGASAPVSARAGPGDEVAEARPSPGLVICAISGRVSERESVEGPFGDLYRGDFAGPARVTAAAQAFGRDVLDAKDEIPPWSVVIAPGVIRLTGRDLEQSYWADVRAIEPYRPRTREVRRGEVTCWTRKSRAKMALTLASLDWSYLERATGLPAMITLTYPGEWLSVAGSWEAVQGHLRVFRKRWERAWCVPLTGAWKREFQDRGAPHIHIGPVVVPLGRAGDWRRDLRQRNRSAVGDGLPFHKWLSVVWADVVNHPDPAERARHERAGTGVDYAEGLRCADPKRLAIYFSKHGSWASKDYQNHAPAQWREQDGGVGRFWGYWNLSPCRSMVELHKREHLLISRTLRHLSERSHVWNPVTRRVDVVKATREVTVWRRRTDRLTGEVKARRRKVRRPVRRLKYHRGFVCTNDAPKLAADLARLIR
jgi:hypothetical protein